jgi:2-phosphosulfolactate phosphatase
MEVSIFQGNEQLGIEDGKVTVVIDVIRAFTTSAIAFQKGVRQILMVKDSPGAFRLKKEQPDRLLLGEKDAHPIPGFDFDNSPWRLLQSQINLNGKVLIQRTTNGVKAVVNNFNINNTFVTGFSNARITAEYIRNNFPEEKVNLIASHPSSDEDMACAEYMRAILHSQPTKLSTILNRIRNSAAAGKFFTNTDVFLPQDIDLCTMENKEEPFVMVVQKETDQLVMKKVEIH